MLKFDVEMERLLGGIQLLMNVVYPELPIQQILIFLLVAKYNQNGQGILMRELQKIAKTPQGTLSRNVKALSQYVKNGEMAGYNLMGTRPDLEHRRQFRVFLTKNGEKVFEMLRKQMYEE